MAEATYIKPATTVVPLEHDDTMPRPRQLLGRGQSRGARPDYGNALSGDDTRKDRPHPPLTPRPIDDLDLNLLDGDGIGVDAEHACRLAGGRTEPAGELRKVVRSM